MAETATKQTCVLREVAGVKDVYVGRVLADTTSTYTVDSLRQLAGAKSVTKSVEEDTLTLYADNTAYKNKKSVKDPTLELELTYISPEDLAYVTGQKYDETRKALIGGTPEDVEIALIYVYQDTDGNNHLCQYFKGSVSTPETEAQGISDSITTSGHTLTFTAVKTNHIFTKYGERISYIEYEESDSPLDFSDFLVTFKDPDTITEKKQVTE